MSCVKTGAIVLIEKYGYTVPADIYEIDEVIIIRWNVNGRVWDHQMSDTKPNYEYAVMYWFGDNVWHREDIGITICPKHYFHVCRDYNDEQG